MDAVAATLFALLAGAGTALSPCVLPVLPVALAAGATGGRRRPLGVAVGLAVTFALAAVLLARALDALGLPGDFARGLAVAVLLGFGVALAVPRLGAALEGRLSRLVSRPPAAARGDGFRSGLVLGASLGLVYAPCAGPILAAVVALDAAVSAQRLLLGFAYGAGAALALLAVMTAGRRLTRALGPHVGHLQQALGVLMVLAAVVLATGADRDFQARIAGDLPAAVVDPTRALERSPAVARTLAPREKLLRAGGPAPEFKGLGRWFNTPGGRPLSLRGLRGRVVLVDFWTYTCINCLRTLGHLRAWDARYRRDGLTIVGVHTPEFPFERSAGNVAGAIAANHLRYPVAQDNAYGTWNAFRNQYWPAKYLIDARGNLRFWHFGEGDYGRVERAIRALLGEAGRRAAPVPADGPSPGLTTPETYLGWGRASGYANAYVGMGEQSFGTRPLRVPPDGFAYRGRWRIERESALARASARIDLDVGARKVFLVLGSPGRARRVRVLLNGRPLPDALAGTDVHGGVARVRGQRLYRLADFGRVRRARISVVFDPGVAGYAFTFG